MLIYLVDVSATRVCSLLDDLKGEQTEAVSFKTEACEAEPPQLPKLSNRTRTSLLLKWNVSIPVRSVANQGALLTVIERSQRKSDIDNF